MAESFIRKISPDQDGLDYESLRKEGIRIVQDICGDVWTDYNLHDPGITILEAFCYALTDLVYRTRFDVPDYLASTDSHIDFEQQALYRPDKIFPSRPVTEHDYRKLILSHEPDIDNVWIRSDESEGRQGLYHIYILLNDRVENGGGEVVRRDYIEKVRQLYLTHRNLCEDLESVEIVEREPFSLSGEIEIVGKREPAKILAEIYFECMQYLCPDVPLYSYVEKYKEGKTLEELFDGVLAGPGYIEDEELYPWRGDFSIPDLVGKIAKIEGVRSINHLMFANSDGQKSSSINLEKKFEYRKVPCLRIYPDKKGEAISWHQLEPGQSLLPDMDVEGIRFVRAGKEYDVPASDVEEEYKRLEYKRRASKRQKHHFDWVETMLPRGSFRNLHGYYSIQNHFPDIYGLNTYGVPDSASTERKAQAIQLKAYLLFFDQVMANYLETLQETPRLFSLDEDLRQSYFHQVLDNDDIPDIEGLYPDGAKEMKYQLARLMAVFDNYGDRRNRVLDYLLGIYGERLSLNALLHLPDGNMDLESRSIENKISFLKEIVDLSSNRFAAFNYCEAMDESRNTSGLKKKLGHLLELNRNPEDTSPVADDTLEESDYYLVEHILLRPRGFRLHPENLPDDDFYAFRVSFVFPGDALRFSNDEFRKLVVETISLNCSAHIYPAVYWLDSKLMDQFVVLHDHWLDLKQKVADSYETLDEAAERLTQFLREIEERHE